MAITVCGVERHDYEDEIFRHHLVGLTMAERGLLHTALHLVKIFHNGQVRDSGEPYDRHVLTTADKVRQADYDLLTVVEALLHDAIEDCKTPETDVEGIIRAELGEFGSLVADDILVVTKAYGGENQAPKILLAAQSGRWRPAVIKLYDREDNVDTIDGLRHKQTGTPNIPRIVHKLEETRDQILPCLTECALYVPEVHRPAYHEACARLSEKTGLKLAQYRNYNSPQLALDPP